MGFSFAMDCEDRYVTDKLLFFFGSKLVDLLKE
jgi:hypothetical protein